MRSLPRLIGRVVALGTCLLTVMFVILNSSVQVHVFTILPSVSDWELQLEDQNTLKGSNSLSSETYAVSNDWNEPKHIELGPVSEVGHVTGAIGVVLNSDNQAGDIHYDGSVPTNVLKTKSAFSPSLSVADDMTGKSSPFAATPIPGRLGEDNDGQRFWKDPYGYIAELVKREHLQKATPERKEYAQLQDAHTGQEHLQKLTPERKEYTQLNAHTGQELLQKATPERQDYPKGTSEKQEKHLLIIPLERRESLQKATAEQRDYVDVASSERILSQQNQAVRSMNKDVRVYSVTAESSTTSDQNLPTEQTSLQVVQVIVQPKSRSQKSPSSINSRVVPTSPSSPATSSAAHTLSSQRKTLVNNRRHGYVLASSYYEQQSMGSRNLLQLQCWAKTLGLSVVKPVMKDSVLVTPLNDKQQSSYLDFGDSFNLADWNRYTDRYHYAPLVEWKTFLSTAPRNVIIVQFEYASVSLIKVRQRAGEQIIHQGNEDQYKTGCSSKWPKPSVLRYLKSKGFTVARTICFNFYYGDQLTVEEFNSHILGSFDAGKVTIIMELWRGIGTAQRVIMDTECRSVAPAQEHVLLSNAIVQLAERYISRYLGDSPYIAIFGRFEMSKLTVHKKVPVIPFCLEETLKSLKVLAKDTDIQSTFVAMDIGRYGTKGLRSKEDVALENEAEKFLKEVYGDSMTLRRWEATFEALSPVRDAGYIALLQKAIVTRAKCILFVGGGAFQRHALNLYRELHPHAQDQCLRVVEKCTVSNKLSL